MDDPDNQSKNAFPIVLSSKCSFSVNRLGYNFRGGEFGYIFKRDLIFSLFTI